VATLPVSNPPWQGLGSVSSAGVWGHALPGGAGDPGKGGEVVRLAGVVDRTARPGG
jgi:hypothetical protein